MTRVISNLSAAWIVALLTLLSTPSLFAHGDHGDAAPPEGGVGLISFGGFQAELLTAPRPPRVGEENKIVVKILRNGSLSPARDGRVLMGIAPAASVKDLQGKGRLLATTNGAGDTLALVPAPEVTWAGNYTLVNNFQHRGPHLVRVAVERLGDTSFNPPYVLEFYLNVAPAPGFGLSLALLLLATVAIGSGGTYWVWARLKPGADRSRPFNFLEVDWLNRFVRWRGFEPVLQIPVLLLTLLIVILGLFDIQDAGKNLATKLTWILWWPGIIFTFILVGRLWCVVCPLGTLNEGAARWANPRRRFPKALRGLWLATLLFVLLTWADEQLGIIRSPQMTAWLILALALAAITTGMLFERRSFCRYLCPITGLQGVYSMVSPIELRAVDRDLCGKDCHQDCYRGNAAGAGCPMLEFPMTLDRNTYCNFCFECVKSCPQDNLVVRLRAFGADLWSTARRSLDESYLILVLVGLTTIVTAQMLSDWAPWISSLSRLIPVDLRILMKPVTYLAVTESAVFFVGSLVVFPALFYLMVRWSRRMAVDPSRNVSQTFTIFAYMFIPIGLAMHLAHNVSHLLLEGAGVFPAAQRIWELYTPFTAGQIDWQTMPLVSPDITYAMQVLLILAGLVMSLVVGYRLSERLLREGVKNPRAVMPFIILAVAFTLLNLYLIHQPMGMRHGV